MRSTKWRSDGVPARREPCCLEPAGRAGRRPGLSESDVELQTLVQAGAEIRYADAVGQPVTFGLRRPVVLLPASLRSLPPGVQRAVLAHELWHVRRGDWGWLIAEETLRGVLWFHPGISWLISQVQASREEVVDELTMMLTSSRRGYVEALLAFANQPPLFAAAPFAGRRHLFHRMLLISKEGVMSSRRIVASCAGMFVVLATAGWYGAAAFPLIAAPAPASTQAQSPPRDPRPGVPRPASARETELQKMFESAPDNVAAAIELATLQELRGATSEAEATLVAIRQARPGDARVYQALAAFYRRTGQFDRAVGALEDAATLDPANPGAHQVVATFYWEKVSTDTSLGPVEKMAYIRQGIAATDRALSAAPSYAEAMIYKNLLLRLQATLETDATRRSSLLAEADTLRRRAMEVRSASSPSSPIARGSAGASTAPPPPPPPPPPPTAAEGSGLVDGQLPLRVGGDVKTPTKIRDVRPLYPPEALAAGVQGVVIIEAVIDSTGDVKQTHILRSIPELDQAALDAVSQWKFVPTLLNGAPVPVIMTVTVNFTTQ